MKKVTATWWAGWVVMFPVRLVVCAVASVVVAGSPSAFYGFMQYKPEHDQAKWNLD